MSMAYKYKYKYSIIFSIYNVEKYIREAIESLIGQKDIDFVKDVQVIMVNDGSPDNVEEICLEYASKYPNMLYIKKENGGLSSARNTGLKHVEGKYVTFFDPDDKLSEETLSNVYTFFEENYDYIDVVAIPIQFFEGKTGEHLLNYKFTSTRVVNLMQQYRDIQLSVATSFIKKEVITQFEFNPELCMAEDAIVMSKILLDKCQYGVVKEATYWYRYRNEGNSIIQTIEYRKEAYTKCLELFSLELINYTLNKKGFMPKFIQYIIGYELRWRVKTPWITEALDEEELQLFKEKLIQVLQYIDDNIIKEQKVLSFDHKIFLMKLKHSTNDGLKLETVKSKNSIIYYHEQFEVYRLNTSSITVQFIRVEDNKLYIEGLVETPLDPKDYSVYVLFNDEKYGTECIERPERSVKSLGEVIKDKNGFSAVIPLTGAESSLKIGLQIDECEIYPKVTYDKYVKLYNNIDKSYFIENEYCIVSVYNQLKIFKVNHKVKYGREIRFLQEILKTKKYKIAGVRLAMYIAKILKKKPVWLFMDRTFKADDNAEHLLRYANKQEDGIKKYYIIGKECEDYERLKKEFNIVPYGSIKHKFLLLLADCMISSHAADFARNHFQGKALWLRNLQDFKFVFLQHGIIHNDASVALGKYSRDISLFVTSAKGEYEDICSGRYYYDGEVVKLTGLPRYDSLVDEKQKEILVMPTWRTYLTVTKDYAAKEKAYNEKFKNSDYFKYYNALINDQDLLDTLKAHGYKMKFFIHPELQHQIVDFDKNEDVEFIQGDVSYQELFKTASLMVTDYSSVAFDFAYLRKPVVYYQFDRDKFFSNHYKPGYFDYKEDGFGEVMEDYENMINVLIDYVKNDCTIKDKYLNRIESFYTYSDRNNCKRVYDEIILLDK